jgi:hypothetical protein
MLDFVPQAKLHDAVNITDSRGTAYRAPTKEEADNFQINEIRMKIGSD